MCPKPAHTRICDVLPVTILNTSHTTSPGRIQYHVDHSRSLPLLSCTSHSSDENPAPTTHIRSLNYSPPTDTCSSVRIANFEGTHLNSYQAVSSASTGDSWAGWGGEPPDLWGSLQNDNVEILV